MVLFRDPHLSIIGNLMSTVEILEVLMEGVSLE